MQKSTNFIIKTLCLLLFSCNSDRAYLNTLDPPKECAYQANLHLIVKDTLSIETPKQSFPIFEYNQIMDSIYLVCYKRGSYRIEVFDIKKQNHLKTISLDPNMLGDIGSFYVHNLDSIFFTKEPTELLMINQAGQLVRKWQLDNAPINWSLTQKENENEAPLYYFPNITQSIHGYDRASHRIFINLTNIDIWYFDERKDFKLHGVFDLENNKWNILYGHLPNIYANRGGQKLMYPFHLSQPFCLIKGDSSIVSFPLDHYIYIYNNRSGELLSKYCTNSKGVKMLGKPLAYEADSQQQANFSITSPHYGQINYHAKAKTYSRLYLHGEALKNQDGTIKRLSDKRLSVIFLNEHFQVVGEHFFDRNDDYDRLGGTKNHAIALSDGFLAVKKEKKMQTDNYLYYSSYLQIVNNKENASK
jgi:hypothetical protein